MGKGLKKTKTMEQTTHKYVRLKRNEFIFFPQTIEHSTFRHMNPISAGFCYFDGENQKVGCAGMSISLNMGSLPDDEEHATRQVYGLDAMLNLTK